MEIDKNDPSYGSTYLGMSEAFTIFAKYGIGRYCCNAEHDEIFAGPDLHQVSLEDQKRLSFLGWNPNPEGGFRKFV